ncbi:hypothetical protein ACTFIT_011102 [Dictyostelium discoideum]
MLLEILNSLVSFFSKIFSLFEGKKDIRIIMIGLDRVGNPILLYKLKVGDVVSTIPSIGFNKHYNHGSNEIIFVVDRTNCERINQVNEEVNSLNLNSIKDRKWYIQPCSAIKSNDIYEGFDWIANSLNNE